MSDRGGYGRVADSEEASTAAASPYGALPQHRRPRSASGGGSNASGGTIGVTNSVAMSPTAQVAVLHHGADWGGARIVEGAAWTALMLTMWTFKWLPAHKFYKERCLERWYCAQNQRYGLIASWLGVTDRGGALVFWSTSDDGDHQWSSLRDSLALLMLGMAAYALASRAVRSRCGRLRSTARGAGGDASTARDMGDDDASVRARRRWLLLSSAGFIAYLHGSRSLLLLLIVTALFLLGRQRRLWPTWLAALTLLYVNEMHRELLSFGGLLPALAPLDSLWPDEYAWHSSLNLVLLRVISFNADYAQAYAHWEARGRAGSSGGDDASLNGLVKVDERRQPRWSYEWRVRTPQPLHRYSLWNFYTYLFYVPLVIAGPTITFNAFASQVYAPLPHSRRDVLVYALRWLSALWVFEYMTSLFPVFTYASHSGVYRSFTAFEASVSGYFALHVIWLKFVVLWRFFRLAAMADGVETVENLNRCVTNTVTIGAFWRGWHASFNRWLVRYIYIPLGGSHAKGLPEWCPTVLRGVVARNRAASRVAAVVRQALSVFMVFTFVAAWHELNWKLFTWGWMLGLCMVPEIIAGQVMRSAFCQRLRVHWWHRQVRAFGHFLCIVVLISSNLIGFSGGLDGTAYVFAPLLQMGWGTVHFVLLYYSISNMNMFIRDAERAGGVVKKF